MNDLPALPARPCRCDIDEPFGDVRDHTCCKCGRQVDGRPIPTTRLGSLTKQLPPPFVLNAVHTRRRRDHGYD